MINTVRASTLANILGHNTTSTIQNPEKTGDAPYTDEDFDAGAQRRYSGEHALKLMLVECLRAQGCSVALAGEFVRSHATPIRMFLDEIEADKPITQRFVLAMQTMHEDSLGSHWFATILAGSGTESEIIPTIAAAMQKVGTITKTYNGKLEERAVGGPWVAMQSIPEAYRLLRQRARAKGHVIDGRSINKITTETEGDEA